MCVTRRLSLKHTSFSSSRPPLSHGYLSFHSNYAEPNTDWQTCLQPCIFISCSACSGKNGRTSDEHFKPHLSVYPHSFYSLASSLPPFLSLSFPLNFSLCSSASFSVFLFYLLCIFSSHWLAWKITEVSHEIIRLCMLSHIYASAIVLLMTCVSLTSLLTLRNSQVWFCYLSHCRTVSTVPVFNITMAGDNELDSLFISVHYTISTQIIFHSSLLCPNLSLPLFSCQCFLMKMQSEESIWGN